MVIVHHSFLGFRRSLQRKGFAMQDQIEIRSTEQAHNLSVCLGGELMTLDEMEVIVESTGAECGCYFSHITKLGAKRYAGNRHWHLKRDSKERGCLDITYWPPGPAMWITVRVKEPDWVHVVGREMKASLERSLAAGGR